MKLIYCDFVAGCFGGNLKVQREKPLNQWKWSEMVSDVILFIFCSRCLWNFSWPSIGYNKDMPAGFKYKNWSFDVWNNCA